MSALTAARPARDAGSTNRLDDRLKSAELLLQLAAILLVLPGLLMECAKYM